jgi:branched-chain amino acid transport system ATP-binding protein
MGEIKKENVSILLAEQNVKQGLKIIDRGYVLENGKIEM